MLLLFLLSGIILAKNDMSKKIVPIAMKRLAMNAVLYKGWMPLCGSTHLIALSQFEDCPVALVRIALVFSLQMFILIVCVHLGLLMSCNTRCFEISGGRRLILECLKGR